MIGEEVYENLMHETMFTRENDIGTMQMRKELDFDIILKCCKKRIEFQVVISQIKAGQTAEQESPFEENSQEI